MKVVAGLGNPGKQYENTRHNLGFKTIDMLADKQGIKIIKLKHRALIGETVLNGEKVMLVKPMTFMNLSGECIKEIMSYYNIESDGLIVIYDDHALPVGHVRVRERGSDGGHNGMKNIIARIGTQEFARIRIGIGAKPEGWDLADYVLSGFKKHEMPDIESSIKDACDCAGLILSGRIALAMNKYNRKMAESAGDEPI